MKTIAQLFLFSMVVITVASCKKDGPSSKSKGTDNVSILTSGTWTFQSYNQKNSSGQWVNSDPSAVHFMVTFNSNNTCVETGFAVTGQWQASSDFSSLTITGTDAHGNFQVVTLTSSSLQLLNNASGELWIYSK